MPDKILILLTADCLDTSAFSCYGNRQTDTPQLDALALQGAVFDEHYAPATGARASLFAWTTGQKTEPDNETESGNPDHLLPENFVEHLALQGVFTSLINCRISSEDSDKISVEETEKQIACFFSELSQSAQQDLGHQTGKESARAFCWIRLLSSGDQNASCTDTIRQLEQVLATTEQLAQKYQSALTEPADSSIAWIISSEQIPLGEQAPAEDAPDHLSRYTKERQLSLSGKLWRPLILSGNFLPEDCPQRVGSITIAQDLHETIDDYLELKSASSPASPFRSLIRHLNEVQKLPSELNQQSQRRFLLLDANRIGLRTETDLTVITNNAGESSEEPNSIPAQYFLKPEDRYDVNDLSSTDPDLVDRRIAELKEIIDQIDQ